MAERKPSVSYDSLHLMELRQMSGVQTFIPVHPVDTEVFRWSKLFLKPQTMFNLGQSGTDFVRLHEKWRYYTVMPGA